MKLKKIFSVFFAVVVMFTSASVGFEPNRANAASSTNVITAKSSYCSITVSWSKPQFTIGNTIGYKIGYSTVKPDSWDIDNDKNWTKVTVPNGDMTYTINNLKPNTKYYCSVGAIDDLIGLTTWEDPYEITTKKEYAAPANLKASAVGNGLKLSWSKVSGADGYKIAYSLDGKKWVYPKDLGNVSSYTISGLKYNTKYYFKAVTLKNGEKAGKWSGVKNAVTGSYAAPKSIKVSKAHNYLTLSWDKVKGVNGYKIAYSTDNKNWTYKTLGNVSSYKITNLKYGTKYYFKIVSLTNNKECGKWSSVQSAVTRSYAAPANIKVSKSYNFLTFSWDKVSGANGYKIAYSADNKKWTYKTLGNVSSYKITGLSAQKKYYFKIVSLIDDKQCGKWSSTYNAVTNKCLKAPTSIKASKTCNTATISWKKVSGANGYRIEYSLDKKKWSHKDFKDVASGKLTGLKYGSKYYIRMVSLKNGVVTGKYSPVYYFTTNSLATTPVTIKSTTSSSITVSWKSVKGAQGYRLQYSSDNKKWTTVNVGNKTSYTINKLSYSKKYYVRVAPMQNNALAASYKTNSAATLVPSAPSFTVDSYSKSLAVTSNPPYGNGYRIYYSTNGNDQKTVDVKSGTTYSIKNLKPATAYTIRVAALKDGNVISRISAPKTFRTLNQNFQFIPCPACKPIGSGNCYTCGGNGDCYACHGKGEGNHAGWACNVCIHSGRCKSCGGSGRCMGCGGKGQLYVDVNLE